MNWIRSEGIPYLEKHVENGDSLLHAQSIAEDFEKYSAVSEVIIYLLNDLYCKLCGMIYWDRVVAVGGLVGGS